MTGPDMQATTRLERFCLARLERFARIATTPDELPPQWRQLARRAALAAYRDCETLEIEAAARIALRRAIPPRSDGRVRGGRT